MALSAYNDESDRELVTWVQAGDMAAFGELYRRYHPQLSLYLTCLTGDDAIGADLAQEAFEKALRSLQVQLGEGCLCFEKWLYRIAINLAKDHWRRATLIRCLPWGDSNEYGYVERLSIAGPEEQVEQAELVQLALAQVSRKYRPCLLLNIVEGWKQFEIVELLGISERSVRRYIKRGLEQLCEAYHRLEFEQGTR